MSVLVKEKEEAMNSHEDLPIHYETQHTKDYGQFRRIKANRPYQQSRTDALVKAIREDNQLHMHPIIVNGEGEIMAGQHRHAAAEILQVWLYFIKDPTMTIRRAAKIDNNTKGWKMPDYLHLEVELGNPNYIILDNFYRENPWIPLNQAAHLLSTQSHQGDFHYLFGEGYFQADRVDFANKVVRMLLDFKPYYAYVGQKSFIATIRGMALDPKYNHSRMMKKVKSRHLWLVPGGTTDDYYETLGKIYNYREPQERWVKLWRPIGGNKGGARDDQGRFLPKDDNDPEVE